jgi:NAD(P)-dependent dehydrogenase (short-subunit alcohol dehydrogenase family)
MLDFSGQVVVITGAAGNLGMAVARAFHIRR